MVPSESTKSSQQAIRTPTPDQPWAASCTWTSSSPKSNRATWKNGWCSMPRQESLPQSPSTVPASAPKA